MTVGTSQLGNPTRNNLTPLREWGYTDWAIVAAMVLQGIVDTAVTLPHWHLEGNPLLLAIGPVATVAFKLSLSVFVLWLWFERIFASNAVSARSRGSCCCSTAPSWRRTSLSSYDGLLSL